MHTGPYLATCWATTHNRGAGRKYQPITNRGPPHPEARLTYICASVITSLVLPYVFTLTGPILQVHEHTVHRLLLHWSRGGPLHAGRRAAGSRGHVITPTLCAVRCALYVAALFLILAGMRNGHAHATRRVVQLGRFLTYLSIYGIAQVAAMPFVVH